MLFESAGRPNHYQNGVLNLSNPIPAGGYEWASDRPDASGGHGNFVYGNNQLVCPITTVMNCDNTHEIYSFHPGGAVFAFGDGSVDFIRDDIDLDSFISLFTRAAGDVPTSR
jgi:prepilin-type processing-associated H-X9-DG protein